MILIVNFDGRIADYYSMEGYTVFSTPRNKRNVHYIGLTLDEMEEQLTKKNHISALRLSQGTTWLSVRARIHWLLHFNTIFIT